MIDQRRAELGRALRESLQSPDQWEVRTELTLQVTVVRIWRNIDGRLFNMQTPISDDALAQMRMPMEALAQWIVRKWAHELETMLGEQSAAVS